MWAALLKNPALGGCLVLGVACAVLFGLERYRAATLDAARAEAKIHQANYDTAIEANKHLSSGLSQLQAAHDALIQTVRADTAKIERAAGDVQRASAAIRANAGRLEDAREEIYRATPSCSELVAIDIAGLCPALSRSLRDQASRQRCSDGGDPGSCPGATSF
jgi:hypothetical protein